MSPLNTVKQHLSQLWSWPKAVRLMLVAVLVALIVSGWFYYGSQMEEHFKSPADRATHGDMYGGLNALFSGLAFAGIIVTLVLQREELELQRQELRYTREELARTATAQESAQSALMDSARLQALDARIGCLTALVNFHTKKPGPLTITRATGQVTLIPDPGLHYAARLAIIESQLEIEEQKTQTPGRSS